MRILYFDCFSGISGDMALGALADIGADLSIIEKQLNSFLPVPVAIRSKKVVISGITATDAAVDCAGSPRLTTYKDIVSMVNNCSQIFPDAEVILNVFRRIGECEAAIHGVDIEDIHFHEIGAIDTLVDVIGFHLALRQLGIDKCYSSPVPLSKGILPMHHGSYPLPAPAALALLKDVPCYGVEAGMELVTPTGAALLTSVCQAFGPMPALTLRSIGYGAGKKHRHDVPNLLRIILGETPSQTTHDTIGVLETNIDDMNPELFSNLFDRFFSLDGALDMTIDNVIMKKNRPGFKIQCLVRTDMIPLFADFLLSETSTLGVRHRIEQRIIVSRNIITVPTPWGEARIKTWQDPSGLARFAPEYDSCKLLADRASIPLWQVCETALMIARRQ
ncbi:MAG: nickel pincer cofactor biosynthesis protein LarC [Ignavibacteriales bacterium]